jgi:MOSC domain-containing protein YiiM
MNDPHFLKRLASAVRPGAYLRILREGDIAAGDTISMKQRDQIVFPAFVALGVALLRYRGIRLLLVPSELPRATMRPSRT